MAYICKEKILEPLEIFGLDKFVDSAVIMKAPFKTVPIRQWSVEREAWLVTPEARV